MGGVGQREVAAVGDHGGAAERGYAERGAVALAEQLACLLPGGDVAHGARNEGEVVVAGARVGPGRAGFDRAGDEAVDHARQDPAGGALEVVEREETAVALRECGGGLRDGGGEGGVLVDGQRFGGAVGHGCALLAQGDAAQEGGAG